MPVQITEEEFSAEIGKKAWHQVKNLVRTIIFIYPLFSLVDFFYLKNVWVPIFIVRLVTVVIIAVLYRLFRNKNYNYRILLHITLLLISCTSAVLCNIADIHQLNIYFLLYTAVILFFNIEVFWEPVHSRIELLAALLLLTLFFNTLGNYTTNLFISNGGHFFFIVAALSCLIPRVRFKAIKDEVRAALSLQKSDEQLNTQNHELIKKDNTITQYERLRELDKQKNNFVNIAGHDLKNLVGSIIVSNNMIKEEEDRLSADQKEYADFISQSADKMQYMLAKLMDVQVAPEMDFDMEVFDINVELRHIFKGLVETAQMKNILLIDNLLKRPINVKLDKIFAGQIFQNLLSNAIKLAQPNNSIRVVSRVQRQKFIFEIFDEGQAIGKAELDEMFNKLKTLSDAPDNNESRLGLGLSIANIITQEMGGELFYQSDDNGNYFKVEFNAVD